MQIYIVIQYKDWALNSYFTKYKWQHNNYSYNNAPHGMLLI